MVHDLIGISNNRVDLRGRPKIPKDLEQVRVRLRLRVKGWG